ncbi:MAG TPA: TIGR04086 family membrane protein [Bacillota bacterium]|nr:TIGR04086 family membrane protein [Bacillota bacterium]
MSNYKQNDDNSISYQSIFKGGLVVLLLIVLLTIVLGTLTHLGWSGLLNSSGTFYMVMLYLALVSGAVYAGYSSQNLGWATGIGVGLVASVLFLMIAVLSGEPFNWLIFILKAVLNCFIGALGGVIGINITKS